MFVRIFCGLLLWFGLLSTNVFAQQTSIISFSSFLQQALAQDELIVAATKRAKAAKVRAKNQQQWNDPQLSLSLANIPTQGSMLRQEPMTQVRLGVQQALPRGRSLDIKQNIEQLKQRRANIEVSLRKKQIADDLAQHYLRWFLAYQTQNYVAQNLDVVSQWVGVLSAHYGSGKHQLQDVVAAQVEQSRLQLKLLELKGQLESLSQGFNRWHISPFVVNEQKIQLPKFNLPFPSQPETVSLVNRLNLHPKLQLAQLAIALADENTQMSKQALEPQLAVNASFGLRGEDRFGIDRADMFSVGISLSQPLFNRAKQDDQVTADILVTESKQADKRQLLQQMLAQYQSLMANVSAWQQQHELYQSQLLAQLEQQVELNLAAYNNDSGDFAQLLDAYVALMNGKIDMARIEVTLLGLTSQLQFLVGHSADLKGV